MKDFNGVDLSVGDKVIYSVKSGSASSMMKEGIVERIIEERDRITIRTYRTSFGPVNRKIWIDLRTGKSVNPFDHRIQKSGYWVKSTGKPLNRNQWSATTQLESALDKWPWKKYESVPNPDYVPEEDREWRGDVYADYLKEIDLIGGYTSTLNNPRHKVVKI